MTDERVEAALRAGDWPITDKFRERMARALAAANAARDTTEDEACFAYLAATEDEVLYTEDVFRAGYRAALSSARAKGGGNG